MAKRFSVSVRKDNRYMGQREFDTIERAYAAYDALKSGYPDETSIILYDREKEEDIAVYRNYHRDKYGRTNEFAPVNA